MFIRLINSISKIKYLIALSIILLLLLVIPDFIKVPIGPNSFRDHSNGLPLIDMQINYSPDEVYKLLQGYGDSGRNYYVNQSLLLDIIIPISLMLFSIISINLIYTNSKLKKHIPKLVLIPLIGCASDLLENSCVIGMILIYPNKSYMLASMANIFTISKLIFCTSSLALIISGLLLIPFKKILKIRRLS